MSKAKLPAILLNIDFYSKPRNRKWIADNGPEAVLILQAFWIASSQESNCKIRKDEVSFLTFPINLKPEKIISILESAVKVGLLEQDSDNYFNSQIVNDHKSFKIKRDNYKKGRQKRDEILPESSENPARIQPESTLDYTDTELDTESETEDLKKEQQAFIRPGQFKLLRFSQIDYENLVCARGSRSLDRTIQLAESHIQKQKHANPEKYRELKLQALEGSAFINGWASRQAHVDIAEVTAATAREKKATTPYKKPDEPPRAQPKLVGAIPKREATTPEQKQRVHALVQAAFPKVGEVKA